MENRSEMNDLQLDCANGVPSFEQFMDGINDEKFIIVIYPAVFCVVIVYIYSKSLRGLMQNAPKTIKSNCISMISIYP